jgi:hypothetical protein
VSVPARLRQRPAPAIALVLSSEAAAVEPPEAVADDQRRAEYHFTLALDELRFSESSPTGGLDSCRAVGRVERVHRRPAASPGGAGARAPREGEHFRVRVWCWDETRRDEPSGPGRVYYGGAARYSRLEIWGSLVDGEFLVFQLAAERTPSGG